jgi:outer membrane protein OmpU
VLVLSTFLGLSIMKKILLATTGLVGAALIAGAASAETPKVTLGGFSDFQAGYTNDDFDANTRTTGFRNDNEVSIHVDGKTDAGLGYGAVIDLEADISADADGQGVNAARTFTYLQGDNWGRVEMGGNKDAAANQRVDASTLAVATGGINGAWTYFVNPAAGNTVSSATNVDFITTSKLVAEHGATDAAGDEGTYNASKVTYYTPRFAGVQAGVSYTPDLTDRGQAGDNFRNDTAGVNNLWDLSLNYENQFANGVKLAGSGAYERGTTKAAGIEDVRAWNVGALVGYQGFSVAGSYGDWGDSNAASGTDQDYWTLGAGYEAGAFGVSATYLDSTIDPNGAAKQDFSNLVLGADYKLAPGLTPYAEVSFYDYNSNVAANDNKGTTFLLGTQLAF